MPGFPGSGAFHDGKLSVTTPEFVFVFEAGESMRVNRRRVLEEIPDSMHGAVLRSSFRPIVPKIEKPQSLKRKLRALLLPGHYYATRHRLEEPLQASLREWLVQRAARLAPGRNLVRVEVQWNTQWYEVRDHSIHDWSEPAGKYTLEIQDAEQ